MKAHKIFFILAILGIAILSFFTYMANRSIITEGLPKDNISDFYAYSKYLTVSNFFIYFILLFVANVMYIQRRYWDTFIWAALIFMTFTMIDRWWLSDKIFAYRKSHGLWLGEFSIDLFIGIMIAIFGLVIALGNYALLKRLIKEKRIEPKTDSDLKIEDQNHQNKNIQ